MEWKRIRQLSLCEIARKIDNKFGLSRIECVMASNWFNPFATLYLNFRSFGFSQALKLPVFVYGRPRLYSLSGKMIVEGKVKTGMIVFNRTRMGTPSVGSLQSEIVNQGRIIFHGRGIIGTGNKIRVAVDGTLELGCGFLISDMINIGVYSRIAIGKLCEVAHRCQILDSNYHYVANFRNRVVPAHTKPITIGACCWICNSTTIAGGTVIPDYTIVASNSLVNKDLSYIGHDSIIGGVPAKHIAKGFRRIYNRKIVADLYRFYEEHPGKEFEITGDITPEKVSCD